MASSTDEGDHHLQYAVQLSSASVLPMVFKAAIELGVLEIIRKAGPDALLSASEIASQLPARNNPNAPTALDPILCLLASYSILTCSVSTKNQDGQVQRLYGLAPVAKYFINNQEGGSLSPFFYMIQDKVMMDMWYHLKDAVLEGGIPFDKAHGISAMEYCRKNSRFGKLFSDSMRSFSTIFMETILEKYDGFEGLKCLVDVGGGNGSLLNMIISKYPTLKGINYDLASVIQSSHSYPAIEHVAGDMFVSIPKGGDAIFMKWITHNCDDKHLLKLLKNCYEALPDYGKVIAVDMVLPETPETSIAAKSLLQNYFFVTSMTSQAKERTENEFENLAKAAGFSRIRVACCACNFSVVEFFKNK